MKRGKDFSSELPGEKTREAVKTQESRRSRPGLNIPGAFRGTRLLEGMKSLKRQRQVERFTGKAQERRAGSKDFVDLRGEKGSEERSPMALEAERGFQGSRSLKPLRG